MNSNINIYDSAYWSDPLWHNIWWSLTIPKGSWFIDTDFGSLASTVKTLSSGDLSLLESYYEQALAWLVTIGRVATVSASASRGAQSGVAQVAVTITKSGQDVPIVYNTFVQVV